MYLASARTIVKMKLSRCCQIFFLIVIVKWSYCETDRCDNVVIQKLCLDQEICDKCLQADECCNWCYDQAYTGRKCNTLKHLSACTVNQTEFNHAASLEVPNEREEGNMDFTKITKEIQFENVIQIKPQKANIRLRKDIPVNFTFTYKSAENYPLDLYYLGDLSASMEDSMKIFKTLGRDLPDNLTQLTENYRLAYGSFMDKTGIPFYINNICQDFMDCEAGYLFRHRLNFTRNTKLFTDKIISSKITANLDDLDGALDAIWQLLVCPEQIGWSKNSRKIILLPTDSLLHMAGDGILAGAILKPKQICLLDNEGFHKEPLKYDYPSLGEIDRLLKEKKVNIIFAVKSKAKKDYYKKLTEDLIKDSAYVGELETDSSNIIQLITRGFNNFVNQVSFSVNTSKTEHLSVKFYADCENNGFNETNICYGVHAKPIRFKVEVSLIGDPPRKSNDILYIEEKNIHETVLLNITYGGTCNCENYSGTKTECVDGHGDFVCGNCICKDNWVGERCEIDCSSHDTSDCRMDPNSSICSGKGDCFCGKCECYFPFQGKFCQYQCPLYNGMICGGPSRGTCSEGECICTDNFKGKSCSCSRLTDNCMFIGIEEICSSKGKCECNQCQCLDGFSGNYCEINNGNSTLCEMYKPYIENAVINGTDNNTQMAQKDDVKLIIHLCDEDITNRCGDSICQDVTFGTTTRCNIAFCYDGFEDGEVRLTASTECITMAGVKIISAAVLVFLATILLGAIIIIISKIRLHRLEKAEYKRFIDEQRLNSEMNPLYKSPYVEYKNPLHSE